MNDPNQLQGALLQRMPTWGEDGSPLPQWAFSRRVAFLIRQHGNDSRCVNGVPPLTCTCGPGVKMGFCALANVWTFFCVAPVIAYWRSSCPRGDGFATCDDLALFGLLFLVVLVGAWTQKEAMGYVIATQLAVTERFKVLGFCFNKYPYPVFLFIMTVFMGFGYLDLMTNAETLGKTVRTWHCQSYYKIDGQWETTMKESIFHYIPGFTGADFVNICLFAYLLMLAQPIFALVYSVPVESGVEYDAAFGTKPDGSQYKFEYKTLYSSQTNHGAALQVLAVATRMEAVNFQDLQYAERRMQTWEQGRGADWELRYLRLANVEIVRGITRFFFVGLFQNAIQTNLQISLMALSREATGLQDNQLLFSVCISLASCLADFPDAYEMFKLAWSARRLIFDYLPTFDAREDYKREVEKTISQIQWKLCRFVFYMFLYACMITYALVKLWGFAFCPEHLINVTGCVVPTNSSQSTTSAPTLLWT